MERLILTLAAYYCQRKKILVKSIDAGIFLILFSSIMSYIFS